MDNDLAALAFHENSGLAIRKSREDVRVHRAEEGHWQLWERIERGHHDPGS